MSKVRVQVVTRRVGDLAKDFIVNTVHFDDFNTIETTDWQGFANDVRNVFRDRALLPGGYGCETKVYDVEEAEPRSIKASAPFAVSTTLGVSTLPREVALCLSYFSERNLPRFRGRLYIGPWPTGLTERPSLGARETCRDLGLALANIGGADVDWGLWSPTRNAFSKITAGWVDDEWDTIRSRGMRATTRLTYTTNE